MKTQAVTAEYVGKLVPALTGHALLRGVDARTLTDMATAGVLAQYSDGEVICKQGDKADAWGAVLRGQVAVRVQPAGLPDTFDVERLQAVEVFGELEILLGLPNRFTLIALEPVLVLRLPPEQLRDLFQRASAFSVAIAQAMAQKFLQAAPKVPLPFYDLAQSLPPSEVVSLLPMQFIERQRVLPVASQGSRVVLGFVDDLLPHAFQAARQFLPGVELLPVRIDGTVYQQVLQSMISSESELRSDKSASAGLAAAAAEQRLLSAPRLDPLLKRMVAEGASDLHLSAHHRPRWRIDGEMREIADAKVLGDTTVWELLEPAMPERNRKQFLEDSDTDFAYQIPEVARFRVNMFRDHYGVGAVLRVIPSKILTMEQLGLPEGVRRMCDHPKGLVLVTGPTGSGKSTTLAAMIDYINRNRRNHIITLEDPIEFLHKSHRSLVNQREVGPHTHSFNRALRAALREDPDIVLVGEMRDRETIQLALETANTGHLVFGTLHTATAISSVDRIIDVFPPEQQSQVRTVVADVLKGVVSQTLLKRRGGGRVAALEILVGSHAVSNLIREAKNHHIFNIMLTQKVQGNQLLNDQLEQLARDGKVDFDEALLKALDKVELAKRFGKEYFEK